MILDGPMDGEAFLAWVRQFLVPTLSPGDAVIIGQSQQPQSRWRQGSD